MKTMLRYILVGLTLAGLTFLSTSYRKDLCYDHDEHDLSVKVNLSSDWEQKWERTYTYDWEELWEEDWRHDYDNLHPTPTDGTRIQVCTSDGQHMENNLFDGGGRVAVPEGVHESLFYNNDTEYIVFDGVATLESTTAATRGVTRSSYRELHAGERTVDQPDMFYGAYIEEYTAERTLVPAELPVTLRPLVYTYMIRYGFESGRQYVALARETLVGMAGTVYLNDGYTGENTTTVLFDCTLGDCGAEALVQSFSVPGYPGERYERGNTDGRQYSLSLEVRMMNGKFKTFEFGVTGQIKGQPRGGVIIINGLSISDGEGLGGGGGFDVDVDGWGEWVGIPLPLD